MIETLRRCVACRSALEATAENCPICGRVQAPPVEAWGEHARRLICLLVIADALETHLGHSTEQQLFEQLLMRVMRGRRFPGGRMVRMSATAPDCFEEFRRVYARWEAAGMPHDFTTVAQLRAGV